MGYSSFHQLLGQRWSMDNESENKFEVIEEAVMPRVKM